MSQSLAKDFNFRSLLKFAFPSIIMMIFMSLYSIVDGFFIAQYVDSMALSAANIVYPAVSILLAVGIMFGTGGSAVVAAKIGQGKQEEANRNFSALTLTTLIIGILGAVLGNLFCRQICSLLGATPVLMDYGTAYLRTILSFAPVCLLQALFQSFFVTAGRPGLGLSLTVSAGITNMLLDYLFVVPLHLGVAGAALATGIGQLLTLIFYLFAYFLRPISVRISRKYLIRDKHLDLKLYGIGIPAILNLALPSLLISFLNGLLAAYDQCYVVVVGIYYKLQTFLYLPANGIIQGMRPLVGFNYGAGEIKRVKKIYHLTLCMNGVIMLLGMIICFTASPYLIGMFTDNATTISVGSNALRIICCGFLISTVSITASGALEGLSKGGQSLIISLLRYILFIIPLAFVLCKAFGPQCVFHAFWITEILTAAIAALLMKSSLRLPGTQA